MITVRFTMDANNIRSVLNSARQTLSNFRDIWNPLLDDVIIPEFWYQFNTEGEGKWPPRRYPRNQPLLVLTEALRDSYTERGAQGNVNQQSDTSLTWGSNIRYSDIHETGTSRIPARPVIGHFGDRVNNRIRAYVDNYVDRKLSRL